jgi:glycosyltransferase involved in cell wall biosynthesis
MIVGFDVTWMDSENNFGGVFQYAQRLIAALVEYTDVNVVAITGEAGAGFFDSLKGRKNFREVSLRRPVTFSDIVKSEKLDVVHTPIQNIPNMTFSVPMISTLHDLQQFHYPEFFTREEIYLRDVLYRYAAELSERVIVSFEHVKQDIVRFYGIPDEKIDVCPLGIEPAKFVDSARLNEIKRKYGLPERYIFYSANTWRHKNHIGLIKALGVVREKYGVEITLVCTGQKVPEYYPELRTEVANHNLEKNVNFIGYVSEDDKRLILKHATLAVIPTLYEAGSFPLMEAMAYEVPVICSNVTSLPATIGDGRFLFDPRDVNQIADKIMAMLGDEKLVDENRKNSRKRVMENSWEKTISSFVNTYKKAVAGFKQKEDKMYLKSTMQNYGKLRSKLRLYGLFLRQPVNFFSFVLYRHFFNSRN